MTAFSNGCAEGVGQGPSWIHRDLYVSHWRAGNGPPPFIPVRSDSNFDLIGALSDRREGSHKVGSLFSLFTPERGLVGLVSISFLAKISAGLAKEAWLYTSWSSLCTTKYFSFFRGGSVGVSSGKAGVQYD